MKNKEVEKFLAQLNPQHLEIINKLRSKLNKAFPDAVEGISYGAISLSYQKNFIYYAPFKNHLGVYPPLTINQKLISKTKIFRNEKGNLIFKYKDEIPYDLIVEVARELRKQYAK